MVKEENGMYTHIENPHLEKVGGKSEYKISEEAALNGFKREYVLAALCVATASTKGTTPMEWYKLLNEMCDRVVILSNLES